MSTTTYNSSLRGKLVSVEKDNSVLIYSKATANSKTTDFISGPETVGTATGYTTVDGFTVLIEVLRATSVLLIPVITRIYLLRENVVISDNPNYDASTDLDRPSDSTSTGGGTAPTTEPYPNGDIPVIVTKDKKTPTTPDEEPEQPVPDGTSTQRKWLTYGLYAILGIAAITLVTILIKSAKTPKVKKS